MPLSIAPAPTQGATSTIVGGIALAGDLGGTGSSAATPRISSITGLAGFATVTAESMLFTAAGTPAATGQIKLAGGTAIKSRNQADTGDLRWMSVDSFDNQIVGDAGAANLLVTSTLLSLNGTTSIKSKINSNSRMTLVDTLLTLAVSLELTGSNVATTGNIRAANNTTIVAARNAANGANVAVLATNGSNDVNIGDSANSAALNLTSGSGSVSLQVAGVAKFKADSTGITFFAGTPRAKQAITGVLSAVLDANAKNVLTSIIAAIGNGANGYNLVTDSTT